MVDVQALRSEEGPQGVEMLQEKVDKVVEDRYPGRDGVGWDLEGLCYPA